MGQRNSKSRNNLGIPRSQNYLKLPERTKKEIKISTETNESQEKSVSEEETSNLEEELNKRGGETSNLEEELNKEGGELNKQGGKTSNLEGELNKQGGKTNNLGGETNGLGDSICSFLTSLNLPLNNCLKQTQSSNSEDSSNKKNKKRSTQTQFENDREMEKFQKMSIDQRRELLKIHELITKQDEITKREQDEENKEIEIKETPEQDELPKEELVPSLDSEKHWKFLFKIIKESWSYRMKWKKEKNQEDQRSAITDAKEKEDKIEFLYSFYYFLFASVFGLFSIILLTTGPILISLSGCSYEEIDCSVEISKIDCSCFSNFSLLNTSICKVRKCEELDQSLRSTCITNYTIVENPPLDFVCKREGFFILGIILSIFGGFQTPLLTSKLVCKIPIL